MGITISSEYFIHEQRSARSGSSYFTLRRLSYGWGTGKIVCPVLNVIFQSDFGPEPPYTN